MSMAVLSRETERLSVWYMRDMVRWSCPVFGYTDCVQVLDRGAIRASTNVPDGVVVLGVFEDDVLRKNAERAHVMRVDRRLREWLDPHGIKLSWMEHERLRASEVVVPAWVAWASGPQAWVVLDTEFGGYVLPKTQRRLCEEQRGGVARLETLQDAVDAIIAVVEPYAAETT